MCVSLACVGVFFVSRVRCSIFVFQVQMLFFTSATKGARYFLFLCLTGTFATHLSLSVLFPRSFLRAIVIESFAFGEFFTLWAAPPILQSLTNSHVTYELMHASILLEMFSLHKLTSCNSVYSYIPDSPNQEMQQGAAVFWFLCVFIALSLSWLPCHLPTLSRWPVLCSRMRPVQNAFSSSISSFQWFRVDDSSSYVAQKCCVFCCVGVLAEHLHRVLLVRGLAAAVFAVFLARRWIYFELK